ncbi:hypothetical protein H4R33_003068 [Dimargaris cristalligena]|nr:hypothetical protein H4R33_003068 [Dimargaris cristalligena]
MPADSTTSTPVLETAQPQSPAPTAAPAPAPAAPAKPMSILRVKRKRTDEPLDALMVAQASRLAEKKIKPDDESSASSSIPKIFRFAETVDLKAFEDMEKTQLLSAATTERTAPKEKAEDVVDREEKMERRRNQLALDKLNESKCARFRVISKNRYSALVPKEEKKFPDRPETRDLFDVIDAVKEDDKPRVSTKSKRDDDITCNLIPMIEEYLNVEKKNDDYVYDVYYIDDPEEHELAQTPLNYGSLFWNGDGEDYDNLASDSDEFEGDDDSNAEDYYGNDYPDEADWENELSDFEHGSDEYSDIEGNGGRSAFSDDEW